MRYATKHNEANGEDNRRRPTTNYSANWGVEGPTDEPHVKAYASAYLPRHARHRLLGSQARRCCWPATNCGRTQQGNNNAYCQDNEISWLDWAHADIDRGLPLCRPAGGAAGALSGAGPPEFLYGGTNSTPGIADIAWFDQHGAAISPEAWNDPDERALMLRRAAVGDNGTLVCATLLLNPGTSDRVFTLPPPTPARLYSTAPARAPGNVTVHGSSLTVLAHGLTLLIAEIPA